MRHMEHGGARTLGLNHATLDFSTSINPLGMHPAVRRRILDGLDGAAEYPDAYAVALEEAAAAYADVQARMVVAGNGATEIIHNVCRHVSGRPVLVPSPGFGEYAAAARICGSSIRTYEAGAGGLPADMPRNGCIFVCNPSNPYGTLYERNSILEVADRAADTGSILVVDECFIEMTPGRNESVIPLLGGRENVLVLRSMTKSFGLAGLRVGYCIADSTMSVRLRRMRPPWSVNALAQIAGVEALLHPGHLDNAKRMIRQEVDRAYRILYDMSDVMPHRTDANYCVIRTEATARDVLARLLKCNILVRDCSSFGMDHHIRISIKTPGKNKILLDALENSCHA